MRSNIKTCIDCKDRKLGCHDTCEKYLTAKAEWDEVRGKMQAGRLGIIGEYKNERRIKKWQR